MGQRSAIWAADEGHKNSGGHIDKVGTVIYEGTISHGQMLKARIGMCGRTVDCQRAHFRETGVDNL